MKTIATEKLYYIMDYNSRYYKVNSQDRLVVAKDEGEATIFSFADANRRIGAGPKSSKYFATPVKDSENAETKNQDTKLVLYKGAEAYDLSSVDWEEYIATYTRIIEALPAYRESLSQKLGETDKKISDILHYIELCDTEEDDAGKLVDLLRICRQNRRDYKDELYYTEMFQKNLGTSGIVGKANEALKAIRGLDNRKYTPRELAGLFGGHAVSAKRQATKQITEEKQMEYVKKDTPFDGRENDWLEFARKQAEFYENADQYMINLKLEIKEIDATIGDILEEVEEAECSMVNACKLFKKLKELRTKRKKKENEIKALRTLTERMDMRKMAEECRRSCDEITEMVYGPINEVDEDLAM